jgi:hypothetical protein
VSGVFIDIWSMVGNIKKVGSQEGGNCYSGDTVDVTVRPDWICIRVVPLDRPRNEKDINRYRFLIF